MTTKFVVVFNVRDWTVFQHISLKSKTLEEAKEETVTAILAFLASDEGGCKCPDEDGIDNLVSDIQLLDVSAIHDIDTTDQLFLDEFERSAKEQQQKEDFRKQEAQRELDQFEYLKKKLGK